MFELVRPSGKSSLERMIKRTVFQQMTLKRRQGYYGHVVAGIQQSFKLFHGILERSRQGLYLTDIERTPTHLGETTGREKNERISPG